MARTLPALHALEPAEASGIPTAGLLRSRQLQSDGDTPSASQDLGSELTYSPLEMLEQFTARCGTAVILSHFAADDLLLAFEITALFEAVQNRSVPGLMS